MADDIENVTELLRQEKVRLFIISHKGAFSKICFITNFWTGNCHLRGSFVVVGLEYNKAVY